MSEFTTEPHYTDDPIKMEHGHELPNFDSTKEWDAQMELALLNAISRCKPVGEKTKNIYTCVARTQVINVA